MPTRVIEKIYWLQQFKKKCDILQKNNNNLIPNSSSLIQWNGQSKQAGETPLPWPLQLEFVLRKCKHMEYTECM